MKNLISRIRKKIVWIKYKIFDPRRIIEHSGERVVFTHLMKIDFLNDLKDKRILEIGPKHGKDSSLLASFKPKELFLIDLPSKRKMIDTWFQEISKICKITYIEGNLLYLTMDQYNNLGKFDLIWCTGVLYHNIEQLRLLRVLNKLSNDNGLVVIESATTRNKKLNKLNVVEIFWPETYRSVPTITHLPSRLAIKSWLEMVGFTEVTIRDVYSKELSRDRAVLTAKKKDDSESYIFYDKPGIIPIYYTGDAS